MLERLDHWWWLWVNLFPGLKLWDPYGASFALLLILIVLGRALRLIVEQR